MNRFLKIALWIVGPLVLLLALLMWGFMYKIQNGFPVSYETEPPAIDFPEGKRAVLLFSKSTGFRHDESIDAGKKVIAALASKNDWFLYDTEEGGAFGPEQLSKFDVVIFNNSTGRVLNDEQQKALEDYVEQGGSLVGIHGSGDNSHHWDWYVDNLVGAEFSHHAIDPHLQAADVILNPVPDSTIVEGLPGKWANTDEWYVFIENPREKGFNILYSIDGDKIIANGNFLWMSGKDFGMGKDHPVAWYKQTGKGRTFYTSMGHDASVWKHDAFVKLIENAVK
ncbi:MAG TPA: ThuA domain-containing protein [Cyclobacteriaceae bacterium]|nr:ThuA domain-containing protein [Cyclobacteriaceae bacterium]